MRARVNFAWKRRSSNGSVLFVRSFVRKGDICDEMRYEIRYVARRDGMRYEIRYVARRDEMRYAIRYVARRDEI